MKMAIIKSLKLAKLIYVFFQMTMNGLKAF